MCRWLCAGGAGFGRTPTWGRLGSAMCHTRGMRFTVEEVARATGGRILSAPAHGGDVIDRVTQDSRLAGRGALFVPLTGKRDGHDFIADAVRSGASAYLVARDSRAAREAASSAEAAGPGRALGGVVTGRAAREAAEPGARSAGWSTGAAVIEVDDTLAALDALARQARRRLAVPVVGVTGSVGKTTVKDLIAAVLGRVRRVHASTRSYNNEIGVPLTLLGCPEGVEAVVVELASRGAGQIRSLCETARPTMGVVTTVGLAHTSEFGSFEGVVSAKSELVEALPDAASGGVAFLNADVPEVAGMAERTSARVVAYGTAPDADVTARDVRLDDDLRPRFTLVSRIGGAGQAGAVQADVVLGARGRHSVGNALAAAAVGLCAGVSLRDVAAGLADPTLSPLRMEIFTTPLGARVINDSYNASPLSVQAALRSLAELPCERRLAALGVMAELGDYSAGEHARMASLASSLGVTVIAVAAPHYAAGRGEDDSPHEAGAGLVEVADVDGAFEALERLDGLRAGSAVLVKGSRVAGLERLAERLALDGG